MSRPPGRVPWLLIAGSALLAVVLLYVLFVGWLPARRHAARLEAQLRDLHAREAMLSAERDALARRLEELQRQLRGAGGRRR